MGETKTQIESQANKASLLSPIQKENFQRDGFLILRNFISLSLCELLIEQAKKLIENYDDSSLRTIFSSSNDFHHAKSLYFLESGDKIRFFFEEGAIDAEGELKSDKLFCINKIGHALHDLDPVFYCFSRMHKLALLTKDLGIHDPLLIQSMYICKQPQVGSEVKCHQDSTYLFTKGQPVIGYWFALEDANFENGCLWAIPGGHKEKLKSRMLREKNNRVATEIYDDKPWKSDQLVPLEVPRGSLIVLDGLLPHMSKENFSNHARPAYVLHVMSARSEFATDNWLQRSKDLPFKGFV